MNGPSYNYLKKLVSYDADTGKFHSHHTGQEKFASFNKRTGYLEIRIGSNFEVTAHRLAWFLSYRQWPERLDHINGNRLDNRLCNLRLADKNQNAQNRLTKSRYLSKCIYFDPTHPSYKKYRVRIQADGVRRHIGWYETEEEAKEAAIAAILSHHGEFAKICGHR